MNEVISFEKSRTSVEEGDVLLKEGFIESALELYKNHVLYLRWDPNLHWRIANCYKNMKRWSDAANAFREVINIDPERKGAWFELGVCLSMLNFLYSARTCFQMEITTSGAAEAKTNLSYVDSLLSNLENKPSSRDNVSENTPWVRTLLRKNRQDPLQKSGIEPKQTTLSIILSLNVLTISDLALALHAIESVRRQSSNNWELCIGLLAAPPKLQSLIDGLSENDRRFKVTRLAPGATLKDAHQAAFGLTSSEYVGFLDSCDELALDATLEVSKAIIANPQGQAFYTDHDLVDLAYHRTAPSKKPAWSIGRFRRGMFSSHFLVLRRDLAKEIISCNGAAESIWHIEVLLHVSERTERIVHIPWLLYHRRVSATTCNEEVERSEQIRRLKEQTLTAHLKRIDMAATQFSGIGSGEVRGNTVQGRIRKGSDDAPTMVDLVIDQVIVTTTAIETLSSDPDDSDIALFHFDIPKTFIDGSVHVISVRTSGHKSSLTILPPQECFLTAIEAGAWTIRGQLVQGWLVAVADLTINLRILVDGTVAGTASVHASAGKSTEFSYSISRHFVNNRPHLVKVEYVDEPDNFLPWQGGGTEAPFQARILGNVEQTKGGIVSGWAVDMAAPDAPVDVELLDSGILVAQTKTLSNRMDVNADLGISGTHGFQLSVPERLFDNRPHTLSLVVQGEQLPIRADRQFPVKLDRTVVRDAADRYAGFIEKVGPLVISGWAADRMDPYRPVHVAIHVDGVWEATVVANQFEKRLQHVTPSGHHGFTYRFPSRLMNSAWHKIEAFFVPTSLPLKKSKEKETSFNVFFPLIDFFSTYEAPGKYPGFLPPSLTNLARRPERRLMAADNGILVSLVVLNWNGRQLLEPFLQSVQTYLHGRSIEIIVVDHGSDDESLQVLDDFKSTLNLSVISRNANYSFSSSNNLAAKKAAGRYLFFVNNDIVFTNDCLPILTEWLDSDPTVGIVGMRLVEPVPQAGGWGYTTHHRGIEFCPKALSNGDFTYFPAEIADSYADIGAAFEVPAVTGAALLCRRDEFLKIGGFDESYFYGLEDVDFCLRYAERFSKRIICDTSTAAIHNRSFTRTARLLSDKPNPILANPKSQSDNAVIFSRWIKRRVVWKTRASLIAGSSTWRQKPLRVTFAVTDASLVTPAGDFYTAMEMAEAMRSLFGWETLFVKRDMERIPDTDVLVVMRHDYVLSKVQEANPGLVTVAWIRNRVDEWLAAPDFEAYHLVFCSSKLAIQTVADATGRTAYLLPIATNEERFRAKPPVERHATDIVFTGSFWGASREAMDILDMDELPGQIAIYGHGWKDHGRLRKYWRQALPYSELPDVYPSAKMVIDDSHPVTREWNSLNSRIFDALGSGTLVLTNCRKGAEEMFDDRLPTFSTREELTTLLHYYLNNPQERERLALQLHNEVLDKHTYKHRAQAFKAVLEEHAGATLHVAIKVGVPNHEEKHGWGDWHFAQALQRALRRAGHHARIDILPEWYTTLSVSDDMVIVLRGLSEYKPAPSKINVMWLISHPDDVPLSEFDRYDHVFVASEPYTELLRRRLGDRVSVLLQCTDPAVFHTVGEKPTECPEILFVGNSRGVRRPIVDHAIEMEINIGVYGGRWDGIIPQNLWHGNYIPNNNLKSYYSNSKIVLSDHWPDMKRDGFISNRIFDAGACGSAIISDDINGLHKLFGDCVITYDGAKDLTEKVRYLLDNDSKRADVGRKLQENILTNHTFDHRVYDILQVIRPLL
ncbi:glycosyltransferase [Azospirillum sp. YIM B02556]|uniref:Glycosyltransferase n=1 Tax=Azospirillum endophyticum TaxID=2800326 RepID=A0ABS1FBE5_9PROT|nr:glycosyltransferase [Azospirillum endophyticum]MBK1840741.1 glycosyltransferase [Azospirillum endophyticum]